MTNIGSTTCPTALTRFGLGFAELHRTRPNTRLFDVIVAGDLMVPALDIAGEAGSFTALDRTLFVTVTDGQLDIRLISRKGAPTINARSAVLAGRMDLHR